MIHIPDWLEIAREEAKEGVMEIRGGEHHPTIIKYGTAVSLDMDTDEIPWCSSFVNWCFMASHLPRTNSARARSWLKWGMRLPLSHPALGCVAVLKRGGRDQPGRSVVNAKGHVGFFIDLPTPYEVTILGGNQSNQVCERTYPIGRVLDYRWLSV